MAQMHNMLAYMPACEVCASACREFEANGVQIRPAMKEMLRKAEADLQQKRQAALQEKAAQAQVRPVHICFVISPFWAFLMNLCTLHPGWMILCQPLRQSPNPSHLLVSAVVQQHLRVRTYTLQASAQLAEKQGEEASSQQEPVTKTE